MYVLHHTKLLYTIPRVRVISCGVGLVISSHHTHTHTHHNVFSLSERLFQTLFHADGWNGSIIKSILSSQVVRTEYMFIRIYVCVDL